MGLWKESYCIGIEEIDAQHKKLFQMVEGLLQTIQKDGEEGRQEYESAIAFMKEYVVKHFRDEEAYQESVGYAGRNAHKQLHREFTQTVLDFERRLVQSHFAVEEVKELAGTLLAWLIYHVADADQKIAGNGRNNAGSGSSEVIDCLVCSAEDVLQKVAGISASVEGPGEPIQDLAVKINLTGELDGAALLGFSKNFALCIVRIMTSMDVEELDELVLSAISEISNIVAGNAATMLSEQGISVDIRPPEAVGEAIWENCQRMQSEIGWLSIGYMK